MKKCVRYFLYALKDGLSCMPVGLCILLGSYMLQTILNVYHPILIAEIFELAPALYGEKLAVFWRDIAILCLIIGLPEICRLIQRYIDFLVEYKIEQYYGRKMFAHAKRICLEALDDARVLDTFQKAEEACTAGVPIGILDDMLQSVKSAAICAGSIYVTASFSLWLLPAAVLGFVPHFILTVMSENRRRNVYRKQTSLRRRVGYLWRQFCQKDSMKEMRVLGFEGYLRQKWVESNVQAVSEMEREGLRATRLDCIGESIKNACYALNIGVALFLLIRGSLEIGQFAACIAAFATLQGSLMELGWHITDFFYLYHKIEEYYDFFEIETEETGSEEYQSFQNHITFDNVSFRYCGSDTDALSKVNLTIEKGEHVVIVGENGSGKTTLSKLLSGAYLPSCGTVSYDKQNIRKLDRSSLYRSISLVPQDFVHYNFSLRENICISDLKYREDHARFQKIIEETGINELVQSVGGLDAQLGREFGGRELSGGEWQKVAIARGLFKDSELIILDEPTSALDPLVEYDILTDFLKLIQNKTSVIISHRVGICRLADKIIVMKNGTVAECGTHETLKNAGGEYSRIWNEQAKWY